MSQGKLGGSSGGTSTSQGGGNDLMTFLFGNSWQGGGQQQGQQQGGYGQTGGYPSNNYGSPTPNQPINPGASNTSTAIANVGNQVLANTLFAPKPQQPTQPQSIYKTPQQVQQQQQAIYQQHPQWAPNYGSTPTPQPVAQPVAHSVAQPTGGTSIPGASAFSNRVGSSVGTAVGKGMFGGQNQTPTGQTQPGEMTGPVAPGQDATSQWGPIAYDDNGNLMPGYQLNENNDAVWAPQGGIGNALQNMYGPDGTGAPGMNQGFDFSNFQNPYLDASGNFNFNDFYNSQYGTNDLGGGFDFGGSDYSNPYDLGGMDWGSDFSGDFGGDFSSGDYSGGDFSGDW